MVSPAPRNHEYDYYIRYQGNIIHLNVLGKPIIVVNSAKIAQDLMDKKSSIYSDRPILVSIFPQLEAQRLPDTPP